MSFSDKVVLITGASSGIGAATAIHFANLGATLAITGRKEENLKNVSEECAKKGKSKPLLIIGDLEKEDAVRKIIDSTIKQFGKLDVLVNNAGFGAGGTIENADLSVYDSVMNTNVRAVYLLTSLAVPHLIKSKGNIVNVSSVAGMRAFAGFLPYCVSKAALDQFTKCIALELAPKQVKVNSVNPRVIITEFHKRLGLGAEEYKAHLERSKETHALGRVGTADEVAKAIAFLASDEASFYYRCPSDCGWWKAHHVSKIVIH